jgi:UDP-3-O-[3-hydroxymyristoyl] N-acetylglucosamine deacetylase / 3-hydroxyacyl-[acyl-carrier-protein] dehydratase
MKQTTIKAATTLNGVGLHTGKMVTMTFMPAPANHGFKFKRVDLDEQPILNADCDLVVSTNHGTTIRSNGAQISTIEHALSALCGLEIDNALIEIDGPEVPILDGSALLFVRALQSVGIEILDADREYLEITEPIAFRDEVTGAELMALPYDGFQVTSMIDFKSQVLGQQYAALHNMSEYVTEIAPCRTFVFVHEVEQLLAQNLIKGGDLDNAIVILDRTLLPEELSSLAARLGRPDIKMEKEGILNTTPLRFGNEPARHKLLDIIGDLSLCGKPIKGKIVASKPGHTANVQFAKLLKEAYKKQRKLRGVPKIDLFAEPLYDTMRIQNTLPHRYPFLLVDKIMEMSATHIIGIKNITINEAFFQGHFPNNPVFPGVLQIEAMAQTGGILALSTVEDPENWDTYFLKIDQVKFKSKVVPGDILVMKLELLAPIRRGIVYMQATAYVGSKIVSEGELTAQISRRK